MDLITKDTCGNVAKTLFYTMPDLDLVQHIIRGQTTNTPDYSSSKEELQQLLQKDDVKEYDPDIEMHEPIQLSQCETVPVFENVFSAFQ